MYSYRPENDVMEEQIGAVACSTAIRRVAGPRADEIFAVCRPRCGRRDAAGQAEAVYRAIVELLSSQEVPADAVASETVFLRNIREDLEPVLERRRRVLEEAGPRPCRPVTTYIEQPPLDGGTLIEVSLTALIPHGGQSWSAYDVRGESACRCEACTEPAARIVRVGDQSYLNAGNIYGCGEDAFEEAYALFRSAEELLRRAGMSFRDVVRTWIYLRDIDRDYSEFNRARHEFFRRAGVDLSPASTGIGGTPFPEGHDFSISIYAVKSPRPLAVRPMSAPILSEASMYGSDFSRGLKVVEGNKIALYISGTASVDEAGRTAHVGDFDGQAERMLVNISSLLAAAGAAFTDLVSAVTYVKDPREAGRLRAMLHERGFEGFPTALVEAPICRPDLLVETEAVAVLPLPHRVA